uniref:Arf-GAP domain-containing protein n=1 Tax=Medicago truncatula TaxID=3880 RepID=I3S9W2_MEDTR|nr:unknown [Medicago truncatula]
MSCSGIHRSLGVHISKVRSATLDTWLPEQVAFIQSMGNERANSYWEAELPTNYDRVGVENFIRAKYEDKRWVAKDTKPKSPSRLIEEKSPSQWQKPVDNTFEERKKIQPSNAIPATRISVLAPPKGHVQVTPVAKHQHIEKVEPLVPQVQTETSQTAATVSNPPPKLTLRQTFLTCCLWMIQMKRALTQLMLLLTMITTGQVFSLLQRRQQPRKLTPENRLRVHPSLPLELRICLTTHLQ